ncbi:hypothetical protein GWI33_010737, partial [Rhynchophorus ferrugineus]
CHSDVLSAILELLLSPYIPLFPESEVQDLSKKPLPESSYLCSSSDTSVCSKSSKCEYDHRQCSPASYIPEAVQTDFSAPEYAKSPNPTSVKSDSRSETSAQSQSPKCRGIWLFKILRKYSLTRKKIRSSATLITDDEVYPKLTKGLIQDSVKDFAEFHERMLGPLKIPTNKNMR